jgi:hypothetical protein
MSSNHSIFDLLAMENEKWFNDDGTHNQIPPTS